ncbi:heterokaryon incompatibility protein-domain-containing protein [Cercophora newfieldiana]|uniref:Heterokaryon incompatibility protein-domain-containing protein n=1 Tax=Cercophora newfieldiana TaxID=92897 RepID=A0AA40CQ28_9PEZI|nr:heterokaryon incompatibility protein-domain-containing protein [Cercophora newfieldiana]
MASKEPLCKYCSRATFTPQGLRIGGLLDFQQHWTFGWVQQSSCPFCALLKRVAGRAGLGGPWKEEDPLELVWLENQTGLRIMFNTIDSPWIAFGQPSNTGHSVPGQHILRPQIDAEINIRWIQGWLEQCRDKAHECCAFQPTRLAALPGLKVLRLIDVRSHRLQLLETIGCPPYVSLSYVWGLVPTPKLTKANRLALMQLGGIAALEGSLPRTIGDAILLVRHLGFQYLWVDSLCLLQDDPDDLQRGVNVMDQIYELAQLTIVAACGRDANSGLPGLRPGIREKQIQLVELQGAHLGIYYDLDSLMQQSHYQTRAWTLQEYLLSRRRLCFVDNKVFFHCRCSEYSERFFDSLEPQRPGNLSGPLHTALEKKDLEGYGALVYHYSRRAITNNSDALRAMAGLTRRFSESLGYPIFYGLPTGVFDAAILFRGEAPLGRRVGFPSYSWAGWIGPLEWAAYTSYDAPTLYSVATLRPWLDKRTWIVWYTRSPSGTYDPIWDPTIISSATVDFQSYGKRSLFSCPKLSFPTTETVPRQIPPEKIKLPIDYHLLQFWTVSCFFKIEATTMSLIGSNDRVCGTIRFDESEQISLLKPNALPREVILLSESQKSCPSAGYEDPNHPERWGFYNIMLLEWVGSDTVAERRGIGTLFKDSITEGFPPGPIWKEILLG